MTGSPFYIAIYLTCVALMAVCDLWLVWQRRKARRRRSQDARWVIVEARPLSAQERHAIDRALAERCRKRGEV